MKIHNIELPPLPKFDRLSSMHADDVVRLLSSYGRRCASTAIASDRKRASKSTEDRFIEAESKAVISNPDYQYYLGLADAYDVAGQIINGEIDG